MEVKLNQTLYHSTDSYKLDQIEKHTGKSLRWSM